MNADKLERIASRQHLKYNSIPVRYLVIHQQDGREVSEYLPIAALIQFKDCHESAQGLKYRLDLLMEGDARFNTVLEAMTKSLRSYKKKTVKVSYDFGGFDEFVATLNKMKPGSLAHTVK